MKRVLAIVSFIIFSFCSTAKNYFDYHKAINKADREIFVSNQIDSGINTYLQVFKQFDFVYLSDCITVMQIALYANNEKAFKEIVYKATQNGLMPRHLADFRYIKNNPIYSRNAAWIDSVYKLNRPHYLKRIDTAMLKRMTYLYANDQLQKNPAKKYNESAGQYSRRYQPHIKKTLDEIKSMALSKGIPSDRLIGVYQRDIMKELRIGAMDLYEYYNKHQYTNEFNIKVEQFDLEEWAFSSTYLSIMMDHLDYSFFIFDTTFYLKQIALGNIHPKDMAGIHDFQFDVGIHLQKPQTGSMYFGLRDRRVSRTSDELHPLPVADSIVNKYRTQFHIPPVEQDRAKWRFMRKKGMFYAFGALFGDRQ